MLKTTVTFTIEWCEEMTEEDLHAVEEAVRNQSLRLRNEIKRAYPDVDIGAVEISHR